VSITTIIIKGPKGSDGGGSVTCATAASASMTALPKAALATSGLAQSMARDGLPSGKLTVCY